MEKYCRYLVFISCVFAALGMAACSKPVQQTQTIIYSGMKSKISEEAKAFNTSGLALAQDGKYKQAIEAYKEAISKEPAYAEAYANCSKAYYAIGNYDMARFYNMKNKEILDAKATVIRESEVETDDEL